MRCGKNTIPPLHFVPRFLYKTPYVFLEFQNNCEGDYKMKPVLICCGIVVLLLAGGFAYVAVTDVPVKSKETSITIPNERFFNAD